MKLNGTCILLGLQMDLIKILDFTLAMLVTSSPFATELLAKNYIYFPHREANGTNIQADKTLSDPRFSGAQIVYTWRSLEPIKDQYNFSAIKQDIAYLNSIDKNYGYNFRENPSRRI